MKMIEELLSLNTTIIVSVNQNETHLTHDGTVYKHPYQGQDRDITLPSELKPSKTGPLYRMISDMMELDDETIHLDTFDEETLQKIIHQILVESLPFIEKVAHDEATRVGVQISTDFELKHLSIRAFISDDLPVILFEMKADDCEVAPND